MNIRLMARTILFCLIACGACVPLAVAQTQTGTVEGKVTDQQGAVLPGVNVTLAGPRGSQTTVTDADGMFRFVGVAPATYSLKAELTGFLAEQQPDVVVGMGKTVTAGFSMKIGGVTQTVERTGASNREVKRAAAQTNTNQEKL